MAELYAFDVFAVNENTRQEEPATCSAAPPFFTGHDMPASNVRNVFFITCFEETGDMSLDHASVS